MKHLLIINPDNAHLRETHNWLKRSGFQISEASSLEQALDFFQVNTFDLALIDHDSIQEHPKEALKHFPPCPVISLDQKPSLFRAVELMAAGASYYLPLPIDTETLLQKVVDLLDTPGQTKFQDNITTAESPRLFATTSDESPFQLGSPESGIIGQCPPMKKLFKDIKKIARTDVTVLIRGESGTGKELVAKAIHNVSNRQNQPMVSVNCAAIPESLIESELFGHEKGAFTGAVSARDGLIAAADNGTLFLDEIGELPLEAQARLLRVLQEGEIRRVGAIHSTKVNIRLVTATHRNLRKMVAAGQFREDLYYRLYVMELILPPLRERGEDITDIARSLLKRACERHHKPQLEYTHAFDNAIRSHNWPGNVRELENAIERATILSEDNKASPDNLNLHSDGTTLTQTPPTDTSNTHNSAPAQTKGTTLDDYFIHFVQENEYLMTETQLAQSLGISRKSLWERRQKLGIPKKK